MTHSNFIWQMKKPRRREIVTSWRSQQWPTAEPVLSPADWLPSPCFDPRSASLPISHSPPAPSTGLALSFRPPGSVCADASELACLRFSHFWRSYVPSHVLVRHLYFLRKLSVHLFCCSLSGIWALILAFCEKVKISIFRCISGLCFLGCYFPLVMPCILFNKKFLLFSWKN